MIIRRFLATRHSLRIEAAGVLLLYAAYEASRGLVAGSSRAAVDHAREVASLERGLHIFVEPNVQHAAQTVPGLVGLLGAAYLTLHLSATAALLFWLHQRRPDAYARIRTTLFLASAIALPIFVSFPTAPPRLAAMGLADTVSSRHIDLNRGLISSLYNPYAAVPSLHIGYATIVGFTLVAFARTRWIQAVGVVYPIFVLLVVVATGNHFLVDAAAGLGVVGFAHLLTRLITGAVARETTQQPRGRQGAARVPRNRPRARAIRLVGRTSPLRHEWSHR